MDWRLIATIVPLAFGAVGTIFGCWSFFWTRKHKILDGLSGLLRQYVSALRVLTDASNARRSSERLRVSFPDGGEDGEAVKRSNRLVEKYNSLILDSEAACRQFEIEVAANAFKFPSPIGKELSTARDDLLRFGKLVNQGLWDAIDIQSGLVKDRYRTIVRLARGWRLRNPFKTMLGISEDAGPDRIKKQEDTDQGKFTIPEPRLRMIFELIHKRLTSQRERSFAVHPPQKLIENPELLKGVLDLEALRLLEFKVVFQDGETQTLSFPELMVLTHQLIFLASQMQDIGAKLEKGGCDDTTVEIHTTLEPGSIMQQATVKALLEKIALSTIPAESL